jgi:hypothetical protein
MVKIYRVEVGIGRKIPFCSADCGGTGIYIR